MEPRIQYAKTKDGVSIAFWTMGEGIPFIHMSASFSGMQGEWQSADYRRWYGRLAAKRKHIRYDPRGSGLSDRDVADHSLDAYLLDLEAVVDRLSLERLALFAPMLAGPVAIAYATRHPEQVSHLILWNSFARTSDFMAAPQVQGLLALMDKDWELFTETAAHVVFGWSAGEPAGQAAARMRESVTQEEALVVLRAVTEFDVTELLPQVKAPTLLLHRRQLPFPDVSVTKELASCIPDASLAFLEGRTLSDVEVLMSPIDEFLGDGEATAAVIAPESGAFRTILFTDVEGSTALTQRLGDAKAREVLREHERMVRAALNAHGGSEVKTMGDGFMASFSSATKALECAIAMQRAFAEHNSARPEPVEGRAEEIRIRIGLNAGEPIAEDDDLFGTAVILAARIAGKAEGGEILTSDTVRGLVAGKKFLFSDRGETAMRGFEDPVRLYEVRWREEG